MPKLLLLRNIQFIIVWRPIEQRPVAAIKVLLDYKGLKYIGCITLRCQRNQYKGHSSITADQLGEPIIIF